MNDNFHVKAKLAYHVSQAGLTLSLSDGIFMEELIFSETEINNADSPFTEIFSLLTSNFMPRHTPAELHAICAHSENALDAILHGMQESGRMFGIVQNHETMDAKEFGFFMSMLANLVQALNTLRSDANYALSIKEQNL